MDERFARVDGQRVRVERVEEPVDADRNLKPERGRLRWAFLEDALELRASPGPGETLGEAIRPELRGELGGVEQRLPLHKDPAFDLAEAGGRFVAGLIRHMRGSQ